MSNDNPVAKFGSDEANKQTSAPKGFGPGETEAPKTPKIDLDQLLINQLLAREARLAKEELDKEEQRLTRQKQRALNAKNHRNKLFEKQKRCRHLKGGKVKSKVGVKDYAVFHHMYIDRTELIGCFVCKMRWRPGDTREYLVRDGKKFKNHTNLGWVEALEMFSESTNSKTSSEIPTPPAEVDYDGAEDGVLAAEPQ